MDGPCLHARLPRGAQTLLISIAGSVSAEPLLCAGHGARSQKTVEVDKGNHQGIRGAEVQPLFSGSGKPSQSRKICFPAEQPV